MTIVPPVLLELQAQVGVITLNRPEKFNCISRGLADGLCAAVRSLEVNPACRVVLLKANGKHFCTGADLDEVLEARASRASLESFLSAGHEALTALERSRLPVVAAVHGLCLAGGLELSMACDVVFAASSARFGDQHSRYGLIPGWGGTQRLPRLVGLRRALHLMYSAEWLDAVAAREWGLVNLVVDDDAALADRAMAADQRGIDTEQFGFGFVRVGDKAAFKPVAGAGQVGAGGRNHAAGAAFGRRHEPAIFLQNISQIGH
jgi:enoyl-CoA hydratase/carnithine racemase